MIESLREELTQFRTGKDQENSQIRLLSEQVTTAIQERMKEKNEHQKVLTEAHIETEQLLTKKENQSLSLKTLKDHVATLQTELLLCYHVI